MDNKKSSETALEKVAVDIMKLKSRGGPNFSMLNKPFMPLIASVENEKRKISVKTHMRLRQL